jgi:hypothetical protein
MNCITRVHLGKCLLFWIMAADAHTFGQTSLSAKEAKDHVGEQAKVCAMVASTHFAYRSKGSPTFINLDEPYPAQIFTAVIWIEDRAKCGSPEKGYANQYFCVVGLIQSYSGTPEIVLRNPSQVEVKRKTP